MRIDYSEPKQSSAGQTYAGGAQNRPRPRKEPVGLMKAMIVVTGIAMFAAGFGTGWVLSQRAAKKAFQAATAQASLESNPAPVKQVQPAAPQPSTPSPTTPATQAPTPPPEPALSFYKALPSGQKNTVLGSGINEEVKPKQPLQAAMPSNLARPQAPAEKGAADKPVSNQDKGAARPSESGFTVQLASFSLRSEAETLRSKLAGKGYNAVINESNQGDKGVWYRVRVGRKLEQEAARELAAKLGKGAIVIPDRD